MKAQKDLGSAQDKELEMGSLPKAGLLGLVVTLLVKDELREKYLLYGEEKNSNLAVQP